MAKEEINQLCYYYPTTAVVLDDSERYITKLSLALDTRLSYVSFSEPNKALSFVAKQRENERPEELMRDNVEAANYGLKASEHQVTIDLFQLRQKIYNPNRFSEPTVLVVDYSMPQMSGEEVCRKLGHNHIKKLMLTGEADEALAVKLFNSGNIDKFLLKSTKRSGHKVNEMVDELQQSYFLDCSELLIKSLNTLPRFCYHTAAVKKIFDSICKKKDIVEYYMISASGSCLLLSFDGNPFWFLIIDENELQDYCEVARDLKASASIIKLLQTGKKIPFFANNDEMMSAQGNGWEPYLFDAEKITDSKTYYYALVEGSPVFDIKQDKILSYKEYLDQKWPPKL